MNKKDFLLEIGVEEIPAGYIKNALDKLTNLFYKLFEDNNLNIDDVSTYSTPRRFTLVIRGVQESQKDVVLERVGPAVSAAYDGENNLTRAAQGFLRGAGAVETDIYTVDSPKGKKIAVKLEKKGKQTEDILIKSIPEIITNLNFPKTMRWQLPDLSFARPIRWLVVLWGDKVLPINAAGLSSSNKTRGNRYLQDEAFGEINAINEYVETLRQLSVIVDRNERKAIIEKQLNSTAKEIGLQLVEDTGLLDLVTDLVEYPTAVAAKFDEKYLLLPEKIVTSTLSQHQKYFSTRNENGDLSNFFIFVSNGDPKYSQLISKGNEKVVKARLEDAEFFFNEDKANPLSYYVDELKNVTFQEKLGTLYDKTKRIEKLVTYLGQKNNLTEEERVDVIRTATLAKADLVTLMLGEKEFTKLQGYMGWKYALISGEKEDVALGIYEHYQPRGQNDSLPSTTEGALTAIADKIDTVCGIIAAGMMPTSSRDPFALRRAANGVIQIVADKTFTFSIRDLITESLALFDSQLKLTETLEDDLVQFFSNRLVWFLQQQGIDYDIIESIIHLGLDDIPATMKRAKALQNVKSMDDFIKLVIGFKRVSNIIASHKEFSAVDENLISEESELVLYRKYLELKSDMDDLLQSNDFDKMINRLIQYGEFIDNFFDDVLVNVDNEAVKYNRYNQLNLIRKLFLNVADVAKIVVNGEIKQ